MENSDLSQALERKYEESTAIASRSGTWPDSPPGRDDALWKYAQLLEGRRSPVATH